MYPHAQIPLTLLKVKYMKLNHRIIGDRRQRGQGMTEYIIIVALIAIAAIGVFTAFGGTIRAQMSGMSQELAGETSKTAQQINRAKNQAGEAQAQSDAKKGLNSYNGNQAK